VEEFNRILVTKIKFPGFKRGIDVYLEKEDLLPFEEAKLYGHNAIHAMIAYLSDLKGLNAISDAADYPEIMTLARKAFLEESGGALCARHDKVNDELFTPTGYQDFADDLLERMVNPYLNDLVERVGRDQLRKLSFDDRLYGTMNIALDQGVEPFTLALGAVAGVISLIRRLGGTEAVADFPVPESTDALTPENLKALLCAMWNKDDQRTDHLVSLTWSAFETLKKDGWL
jgi:mannitol-1-phosphate 5-dehydrogenase